MEELDAKVSVNFVYLFTMQIYHPDVITVSVVVPNLKIKRSTGET